MGFARLVLLVCAASLAGAWWASVYTSTQGASFGALSRRRVPVVHGSLSVRDVQIRRMFAAMGSPQVRSRTHP
jgi:hypothetical protein